MKRIESTAFPRAAAALMAIVLSTGAGSARAADSAEGAPTPPPASATKGSKADLPGEEASTRFKRGLQLFDEGDYTLALVEFERAYQLAPNYRALYNISLVNMQLGRYADAVRTLEQYVHDGGDGIPPARRDEVAKSLAELRLRTATVDIATNAPNAEVTLDGKPVESARLQKPMLIDAGEHTLRATAPGFQPGYRTMTLAGADRVSVRLQLVALAAQPKEIAERGRTLFWPGFVATGALAAGAIVSGVLMLGAHSRFDSLESQPSSSAGSATVAQQRTSAANQVNSAALAADILTGLAVATGGISLYLSLRFDHSPRSPTAALAPNQVVFSGAF